MEKKLLVVSDGIIHPSIPARARFRKFLMGIAGVDCAFALSIEAVRSLGEGGFDAVAVYLHRKVISDGALAALEDFVRGGGGFLPVHSASASFKTRDRYFDILGGRFIGHGKIAPFTLRRARDGIFNGIEDYTVRDELYLHEYDRTNTVHFVTDTDRGSEPQVWTRSYGGGRVCYYAPGHCAPTMKHPGTIAVLARGLRWVCGLEEYTGGPES